jgi:hypothetical protein
MMLKDDELTRDDCVNVVQNIIQNFNIEIKESDQEGIFGNVTPTTPPEEPTTSPEEPTTPPEAPTMTAKKLPERIYKIAQLSAGIFRRFPM